MKIEFRVNGQIISVLNIDKDSPVFWQMLNLEAKRITKELESSCEIEWRCV